MRVHHPILMPANKRANWSVGCAQICRFGKELRCVVNVGNVFFVGLSPAQSLTRDGSSSGASETRCIGTGGGSEGSERQRIPLFFFSMTTCISSGLEHTGHTYRCVVSFRSGSRICLHVGHFTRRGWSGSCFVIEIPFEIDREWFEGMCRTEKGKATGISREENR